LPYHILTVNRMLGSGTNLSVSAAGNSCWSQ
jgi:hypothetical protein